jgi:hypothetical protein
LREVPGSIPGQALFLPVRGSNNTGSFLSVVSDLLRETWPDMGSYHLLLRPLYVCMLWKSDDIHCQHLTSEAPSISSMMIETLFNIRRDRSGLNSPIVDIIDLPKATNSTLLLLSAQGVLHWRHEVY